MPDRTLTWSCGDAVVVGESYQQHVRRCVAADRDPKESLTDRVARLARLSRQRDEMECE